MKKPWGLDLFEAVFLAGMYEEFRAKAARDGRPFTVSRERFVRDLGAMLDLHLAQQNNGAAPREPVIKVVGS